MYFDLLPIFQHHTIRCYEICSVRRIVSPIPTVKNSPLTVIYINQNLPATSSSPTLPRKRILTSRPRSSNIPDMHSHFHHIVSQADTTHLPTSVDEMTQTIQNLSDLLEYDNDKLLVQMISTFRVCLKVHRITTGRSHR